MKQTLFYISEGNSTTGLLCKRPRNLYTLQTVVSSRTFITVDFPTKKQTLKFRVSAVVRLRANMYFVDAQITSNVPRQVTSDLKRSLNAHDQM